MSHIHALGLAIQKDGSEEDQRGETRGDALEQNVVDVFGHADGQVSIRRSEDGDDIRDENGEEMSPEDEEVHDVSAGEHDGFLFFDSIRGSNGEEKE